MMQRLFLVCVFSVAYLPASSAVAAACYPVSGESISARDLALAIPKFSQLQSDLTFGFTPTPGVERQFSIYELQRIARQYGVNALIERKACFAWPLHSLEKDRVMAAMEVSLAGHRTAIEIIDQDRTQVPPGEVFFPLPSLSALSDKPAIWKGYIAFSPSRRFSTWALVRVRVREQHLIALRHLNLGEPLRPEQFRSEQYVGPVLRENAVSELGDAADIRLSHDIPAGATLMANMLSVPPDVRRGDLVTVTVDSGAAHLEAPGLAAETGSSGNIVLIKNPRSGNLFKARVVGRGHVQAIPGVLSGLAGTEGKS